MNNIFSYIIFLPGRFRRRSRQVRAAKTRIQQKADSRGFTLVEIIIVMAVLALLAMIALPLYAEMVVRARYSKAKTDIQFLEKAICVYETSNGTLPASLDDIEMGSISDPWSNPYKYTLISSVPIGKVRKDKFLVPLNTDYDLYSMGPDGKSKPPLTAMESRDDVIRANDGGYIGVASEY